jgi:hypothetical protein
MRSLSCQAGYGAVVYFGACGITGNLIIIVLYIVVAITVAITGTSLLAPRPSRCRASRRGSSLTEPASGHGSSRPHQD